MQRLWPPWSNHYYRYYDQTTASRLSTARNTTENQRYTAADLVVELHNNPAPAVLQAARLKGNGQLKGGGQGNERRPIEIKFDVSR